MELSKGSYQKLNDLVILLRKEQTVEDRDILAGLSGFKGYGKSTLSKQIVIRYVEKFMGVKKFTPSMLEKYTAYTGDDLFRLLDELPEYSPIDVDEAVNFALGEDWMKSENKRMKKVMTKIRTKHHIFLFNIPDIWWLDRKYRENMMTYWIHIVKKGHAMLSTPNTAPGVEDRWNRPWLVKTFTKNPIDYFTPIESVMSRLRKYSCYKDDFDFPKLDAEIYQKHLELRDAKIMETPEEDEKDLYLRLSEKRAFTLHVSWHNAYNAMKENGHKDMTMKEFATMIGMNPLDGKQWVDESTVRKGIQAVEKLKRKQENGQTYNL